MTIIHCCAYCGSPAVTAPVNSAIDGLVFCHGGCRLAWAVMQQDWIAP